MGERDAKRGATGDESPPSSGPMTADASPETGRSKEGPAATSPPAEGARGTTETPEYALEEHRRLGRLFEDARAAVNEERDKAVLRRILLQLAEALRVHFEQEESLYYPTLYALRPTLEQPLHDLMASHPHLVARIEELAGATNSQSREDIVMRFERFARFFNQHEHSEEEVLLSLDWEFKAAREPS